MKTKNAIVRRRVAAGPCGENCNCPGDPGCPDFGATRSASLGDDVTKSTFLMNGYHRRGAMGDFDMDACLEGGAGLQACQQAANAYTSGAGGAASPGSLIGGAPATPPSSGGASAILGNVGAGLAAVFGQRPGMPIFPYPYRTGMSTTTKMLLVGGAAVGLVLFLRR